MAYLALEFICRMNSVNSLLRNFHLKIIACHFSPRLIKSENKFISAVRHVSRPRFKRCACNKIKWNQFPFIDWYDTRVWFSGGLGGFDPPFCTVRPCAKTLWIVLACMYLHTRPSHLFWDKSHTVWHQTVASRLVTTHSNINCLLNRLCKWRCIN